jgi:hypothetical protein
MKDPFNCMNLSCLAEMNVLSSCSYYISITRKTKAYKGNGIRMDLREAGGGVNWIRLAQDRDRWPAIVIARWIYIDTSRSINIDMSMDIYIDILISIYLDRLYIANDT